MDYGGGLENRFRASERGFESRPLRQSAVIAEIIYKRRKLDENPRIPGQGAAV